MFIFQNAQAGGDRKNDMDKEREKKKKESILDLNKYLDKPIRVKFSGGREGKIIANVFFNNLYCILHILIFN